MRGIQKEMNWRPRNINQYLYVRSIGPGCCATATQCGEWQARKIPGTALWTSSARTAGRHCPRWIVFPSEPFLGDQKWYNCRERGLDCMEDDREPPTWILLLAFRHVTCTSDHLAADSELPRSCQNHSLLHTQRYCHRFAHSRLGLVSFLKPPARFFLIAPHIIREANSLVELVTLLGAPSSRLGYFLWSSWCTKQSRGRLFPLLPHPLSQPPACTSYLGIIIWAPVNSIT